jgi:two-component system response regulator PilR (NtrC family)
MHLPDGNGLELVTHISKEQPGLPVAVITAFGSMDTAINALKAGAFDFVQKPVDLEQLRALVDAALKISPISATSGDDAKNRLIGASERMDALRAQITKLARSQAPIYISGESGSGKEVAARLIHEQGPRADGPFVPVNCGAIPSELMESEFFGHIKGSFTGAVSDKAGLFEAAEGGTLFLDEVADLPLSMQVKLLRAIQEKTLRPVGSAEEKPTEVRVLSATHKDLSAEVAEGRFRQDLYYRLNVIELSMPSLRERASDIPELAEQILYRLSGVYEGDKPELSDTALTELKSYPFPGNVRELENILERAYTLCDGKRIESDDLQLGPASPRMVQSTSHSANPGDDLEANEATTNNLASGQSLEDYLESVEKRLIVEALEATRWNKTAAAKKLGITFRALRYRLQKLDLE